MRESLQDLLFSQQLLNPLRVQGIQAWYDDTDPSTILTGSNVPVTDGGAVAGFADKSGNSSVLCFVSNIVAGNSVSSPNKTVTGNQVFELDINMYDYTPAADRVIVNKLSGNYGFQILLLTTGVVRLRIGDGAGVTNVDSTVACSLTDLSRGTIGITWNDGVGASFTQNGSALGDAVPAVKTLTNAAVAIVVGLIQGKIYRFRAVGVYDFNPSSQTSYKLSNGDTVTIGGDVWTLASTGATGARIAGERDRYQGTVANRQTWLQWSGSNYGWLNGTAGNYFSTPDSAAVSMTGDIDLRWYGALVDWTPSSINTLIAKYDITTGQRSYWFYVTETGNLVLIASQDGSAIITYTSSAATGISDFTYKYVRVTLDLDNGTNSVATFYISDDGVTWTPLGTAITGTILTSIFDGTQAIEIGTRNAGGSYAASCRVGSAKIYNGINGTLAASFNPSRYVTGPTFVAETGETWTVNGGAHIVTRTGLYGGGVKTCMQTAKYAQAQPLTTYVFGEQVSWTSGDVLIDGTSANSGAIVQTTSTPQLNLNAGTRAAANTGFAVKAFGMLVAVFNGAASLLGVNRTAPATGDAGAGAPNGFTSMASGSLANNANMFEGEVIHYSGVHGQSLRDRFAFYGARKHRFSS